MTRPARGQPKKQANGNRKGKAAPKQRAGPKPKAKANAGSKGRGKKGPAFTPRRRPYIAAVSLHGHHSGVVPTVTVSGHALPQKDVVRYELTHGSDNRAIIIATNVGPSATCLWVLRWNASGVVANLCSTPTLLSPSGSSGGPTAMRAMKMTTGLLNSSQKFNLGGRLYTLNCDQRLLFNLAPSAFNVAECETLYASILQHPDAKPHEGGDYHNEKTHTCTVVDPPSYERFEENDGPLSVDAFGAHIAQWPNSTHRGRPMSIVIFALDFPPIAQTYTFSSTGHWYTRWPLSTVPGRLMTPIPTAPPAVINQALKAAESMKHVALESQTDPAGW